MRNVARTVSVGGIRRSQEQAKPQKTPGEQNILEYPEALSAEQGENALLILHE